MKDFMCEYKKGTNLGELYLLPIDKRLYDVPGRPVISNYSTPKENFSSYYALLEEGWPYIKDTEEFLKRLQNMEKNPSRFYLGGSRCSRIASKHADLETLKDALDCRQNRKIPTDMLVRMAEFLLTNNYFNMGEKYSIKLLEPLLTRNLHDLIRAILWIILRWIFLK